MIDPALIQIATSNFTISDDIYTINRDYNINGLDAGYHNDNLLTVYPKIANNTALTSVSMLLYVNDVDIIYSDLITTYQDRLARIIDAEIQIAEGFNNTSAGTYGSMITSITTENSIMTNAVFTLLYNRYSTIPYIVVVPPGNTFSGTGDAYEYINLPSDW